MRFITLGSCCSATFALHRVRLRQENNIFEWMMAVDFGEILDILERVCIYKQPIEVISHGKKLFFKGTNIHSKKFGPIPERLIGRLERRSRRLIDYLQSGEFIVFVRHETGLPMSHEHICRFRRIVEFVNPMAKYAMLLFCPPTTLRKTTECINDENVFRLSSTHQTIFVLQ